MSQPQDPRQTPLQDDELALARVLRALPAGEPSAKIDAAILAAATDAVVPRRTERRPAKGARWLPTWAIGTAAAAVLAIGVGTQLQPPVAPDLSESAATPAPVAAPPRDSRTEVEFRDRPREITPTYPPPEDAGKPQAGRPAPPPPPPAPPPAEATAIAAPASPEPFPAPAAEGDEFAPALDAAEAQEARADAGARQAEAEQRDRLRLSAAERNLADAARRDEARRNAARQESGAGNAAAAASAVPLPQARMTQPAPAAAPPQEVGYADADAAAKVEAADTADAVDVIGNLGRIAPAETPLPAVGADATLPPSAWIERIRERIRRGDRAGALDSLQALRRAHPQLTLPADLAALR